MSAPRQPRSEQEAQAAWLRALREFEQAALRLTCAWYSEGADPDGSWGVEDYPCGESFDEFSCRVSRWRATQERLAAARRHDAQG